MGTTAFPDQMGDYYPEFLASGRIIQGHDVSGPLNEKNVAAVNKDLGDAQWREIFHKAFHKDYRFQRGLFDISQLSKEEGSKADDPSVLSKFTSLDWKDRAYQVESIKDLSRRAFTENDGLAYEYGWALLKTSASLVYTLQLCKTHHLGAVTDSPSHSRLLNRTCTREGIHLSNSCISREGY